MRARRNVKRCRPIEKECSVNGLRCDVVTLYSGALYHLYKYKKYDDVRLVFAPEFDIAFFGGDPDNFEYPRYDLDISFFRAYENGEPAKIKDYLKWSKNGVQEGDLVFVSGHPGRTGRLLTVDQLDFLRDYQFPMLLASYPKRLSALQNYSGQSEENSRQAEHEIFGIQNSFKAVTGFEEGLKDPQMMGKKSTDEKDLKNYVSSDAERQKQYGNPWIEISKAVDVQKEIYKQLYYVDQMAGFRGDLADYARAIVRSAQQKEKPSNERIRGYQDSALPTLEQRLFSTAPVYKGLEKVLLAESLTEMQGVLGPNDETLKKTLDGKSPEERAKEVIDGTKLDDVAVRKQLYEGERRRSRPAPIP